MPTSGAAFRLFNKDGDSPIHASITILLRSRYKEDLVVCSRVLSSIIRKIILVRKDFFFYQALIDCYEIDFFLTRDY